MTPYEIGYAQAKIRLEKQAAESWVPFAGDEWAMWKHIPLTGPWAREKGKNMLEGMLSPGPTSDLLRNRIKAEVNAVVADAAPTALSSAFSPKGMASLLGIGGLLALPNLLGTKLLQPSQQQMQLPQKPLYGQQFRTIAK